MIIDLVHIFFLFLFIILSIFTGYLLLLSLAGFRYRNPIIHEKNKLHHIAVLITSRGEDEIIVNTVRSAMEHDYPSSHYQVIVAADQLRPATLQELQETGAQIIELHLPKGSKARSLHELFRRTNENKFSIALVLDGDNIMKPGTLHAINAAFADGANAVQVHRTAKNTDTPVALFDAISEEVNNHLFRKGSAALRLSASLIGSGMAFRFSDLKRIYQHPGILDNPACDREVDYELLRQNIHVKYLHHAEVLDEKVATTTVYRNQRRRWLESQLIHLKFFFNRPTPYKNIHYWHKFLLTLLPPRLLFTGLLIILMLVAATGWFFNKQITGLPPAAWSILTLVYLCSLLISIPRRFYSKQTLFSLAALPGLFIQMIKAVFTLRPGRKEFVHTPKSYTGNTVHDRK